jgi:multisubunit Na+/H+ antiporter MnhE subunit
MPSNLLGVPVFVLLIWLHIPLWRYFVHLIGALSIELHRRVVVAALVMVSVGYLIIFATVFDYSRWISNWAVCMFLILHAVKTLPGSQVVPPVPADDRNTTILGWIITLIPRVGIVRPF